MPIESSLVWGFGDWHGVDRGQPASREDEKEYRPSTSIIATYEM